MPVILIKWKISFPVNFACLTDMLSKRHSKMQNSRQTITTMPVNPSGRHAILALLRGIALPGIALANFPEFALYTFLSPEAAASMPSADAGQAARFLQYVLIDGKSHAIFSLLFGIGFSIIIHNAMKRGANGLRIFYRRMLLLWKNFQISQKRPHRKTAQI